MVAQTAREAVDRANRSSSNSAGMCLMYVRTWLDIPAREGDAIAAWNTAQHKHAVGRDRDALSPPRGAPVFWRGGSAGHGHIALAVSNTFARSTDTTTTGHVTTALLNWWRVNWGLTYLGWTEDVNGVAIPYLRNGGELQWAHGDVYVEKLHRGQRDSDSVSRLCYRLRHHKHIPREYKPRVQSDSYDAQLVKASRYWQTKLRANVSGPKTGTSWSNVQTNLIFGDRYDVIEK